MSRMTVSTDWDYFQSVSSPGWWVIQNPWNNGSLVNGRDYTQTVTADTAQFPNATVLSWSWPDYANTDNVWSYPELVYGSQAGFWQSPDGMGPTPIQVKNLSALSGSFNMTLGGSADQYDVLWETHLTSAANSGQIDEFGVFLHEPTYVRNWLNTLPNHYAYNAAGLSATIYVTSNGVQPYIIVSPSGDMLSGTIDLKAILTFLTAHGVISGNEYIEGFEMGAEPEKGSGSLAINSIGYDWNGNLVGTTGANTPPAPPQTSAAITIQSGSNPSVTLDGSKVQSQTIYGASVAVTAPAVAVVALGSLHDKMRFTNMVSVNVRGGSASSTISADAGSNTFTAGTAALSVEGGSGPDTYVFHKNDAVLTVQDFTQAKGDAIDVDSSLVGTAYERSDHHGGSNIYFHGSSGHIHLVDVAAFPLTAIHFSG